MPCTRSARPSSSSPTRRKSPNTVAAKCGWRTAAWPRTSNGRAAMLFDLLESFRSALGSIRMHGFRSFLTTLGIIIGVAAVIALVSIIQGFSYSITQQFAGLGTNSLIVQAYTPISERLQGRIARLTPEDFELIRARVDGIASITPILFSTGGALAQIRYGSQVVAPQLSGTT